MNVKRFISGVMAAGVLLSLASAAPVCADEDGDRLLGGIVNGLLGPQQPAPDQVYNAKERERLASLLQSGEYVTSRQGEPVDLMVYGIPLTHRDHVYTAKPIPASTMSGAPTR